MGIESEGIKEESNEPLFGKSKKKRLPYPEETQFKFFVGCLDDEADRLEYEQLLTKSFLCQNELKKPGDLAVLDMNSSFDKQGHYHVVSRYAIIPEKEEDAG